MRIRHLSGLFVTAALALLVGHLMAPATAAESIADSLTFERWCADRHYSAERCKEKRPDDMANFRDSQDRIRRMELRNDEKCEEQNRKMYELECGEMFDRSGIKR